jgi:hypothetical protein
MRPVDTLSPNHAAFVTTPTSCFVTDKPPIVTVSKPTSPVRN